MALCQAIFNILGIVLFYPLPYVNKVSDQLAMKLGNKTAKVFNSISLNNIYKRKKRLFYF